MDDHARSISADPSLGTNYAARALARARIGDLIGAVQDCRLARQFDPALTRTTILDHSDKLLGTERVEPFRQALSNSAFTPNYSWQQYAYAAGSGALEGFALMNCGPCAIGATAGASTLGSLLFNSGTLNVNNISVDILTVQILPGVGPIVGALLNQFDVVGNVATNSPPSTSSLLYSSSQQLNIQRAFTSGTISPGTIPLPIPNGA